MRRYVKTMEKISVTLNEFIGFIPTLLFLVLVWSYVLFLMISDFLHTRSFGINIIWLFLSVFFLFIYVPKLFTKTVSWVRYQCEEVL
jgi:hypothetical protein